MRQIKFRGKRVDNGEWVYGDYFKTPLTDENSGLPPDSGWFFLMGKTNHCIGQDGVAFVVDPATIGQFTGLLDKNGKEIWEGDILESSLEDDNDPIGVVYYYAPQFIVQSSDATWQLGGGKVNIKKLENSRVIGNLHDSPSLTNH